MTNLTFRIEPDSLQPGFIGVVMTTDGTVLFATHTNQRADCAAAVATALTRLNPAGPCSATRRTVYKRTNSDPIAYTELVTYDAHGNHLERRTWMAVMDERRLDQLVAEQMGFPLQAATPLPQ